MKPLAVLLLVAAALAGLYLALSGGSDSPSTNTGLERSAQTPEDSAGAPAADLAAATSTERTIAEIDPGTTGSNRVDSASAGDGTRYNNSLFGVVMNTKGVLLPGAEVTLTRAAAANRIFANEPIDRSRDITAIADDQGKYLFVNVEPYEFYMVEAEVEGYARNSVDGIVVGDEGDFEAPPVQLTLGSRLVGVVRDTGGNVVPGAKLTLADQFHRPGMEETPDTLTTLSDGSGHYVIESIPPGNRTLTIEADGYGNMSFGGLLFRNTEPVERDVVLEIAEMISGRVIGKSGESIEGAEVMAMSYTNASRACRDVAFTDADGAFTLDSLSQGQYTLSVRAVGYRPGHESRVKTGASGLLIQLSPQATISGRVLADGGPPPQYKVRLRQTYPNNPATSAIGPELSFNNPDGSFLIDSVQPNTYVVQATAPGYAPSYSDEFSVGVGMPVKGVIVRLKRGGALVGRVVNKNGKPLPKPKISTHDNTWANTVFDLALGDQFPTNATSRKITGLNNGKFKLGGLKGETYQVRISVPGYCELILQDTVVVDGQDTDLGDVSLIKGGTLSGRVMDASGQPLVGAKVNLRPDGRPEGLPRIYNVRSGADGKYLITGIFPGSYVASASRPSGGSNFLEGLSQDPNTTQKITVGDEQNAKYDLKVNH